MLEEKQKSPLTADKVTQAVTQLQATGVLRPSVRAVRAYLLKTSSSGTVGAQNRLQLLINECLCKQDATAANNPPPAVSVELLAHLERAMREVAQNACEKQRVETEQLREEQDALRRENGAQQEQLAELIQVIALRTTERDALSGQIVALNAECSLVKAALTLAHDSANHAQYELGRAQSQLQSSQASAKEKTLEAGHLTQQAHRLQGELIASQIRTAQAIHDGAILQGKLDSQVQARQSLDAAHATLQAQQAQQALLSSARGNGLRGRGGHAMTRPGA